MEKFLLGIVLPVVQVFGAVVLDAAGMGEKVRTLCPSMPWCRLKILRSFIVQPEFALFNQEKTASCRKLFAEGAGLVNSIRAWLERCVRHWPNHSLWPRK